MNTERRSQIEKKNTMDRHSNKSPAVMMAKRTASYRDGLDYFPTPPHATHALMRFIEDEIETVRGMRCLEPAAGGGHMVEVLNQYFEDVIASDVQDYGQLFEISDYLWRPPDTPRPDWIITNPPFKFAERFALKAIQEAASGAAMLCRLSFLESIGRHDRLFRPFPPSNVLVFTERVHMTYGRLPTADDSKSIAALAWFVWRLPHGDFDQPRLSWVPPGGEQRGRIAK